MIKRVRALPTPVAGLALGISSLGWSMENALTLNGWGQLIGATIAVVLLSLLLTRFVFHVDTLITDHRHPVLGSIVPTFAMATMVVSKAIGNYLPLAGEYLWLAAVVIHLLFLCAFIIFRLRERQIEHMVPSWFIPPVGIIVADVACPGPQWYGFAQILLTIGIVSYAVMLPAMIYRFMFYAQVPDAAKPTIAILAAPASLSLAGLLTVVENPSPLLCAVLLGIAVLMTVSIYLALFKLLRLPFSPGYAAFTFPLAIGATALYKMSNLVGQYEVGAFYAWELRMLANFELVVATCIITYVTVLFIKNIIQDWIEKIKQLLKILNLKQKIVLINKEYI